MSEKRKISVGMNARPGNPKIDLVLEKLNQHRQDHQRQSGMMNSIADQVSRLQFLMARIKGETKAIHPSTEVMLRVEDKIIETEGRLNTLENLILSNFAATNKIQDNVKILMATSRWTGPVRTGETRTK